MDRPIGGYFELEKTGKGGNFPQRDGALLNTGRNALEYILASLGNVLTVYIPYYTCDVVLEPFKKLGIEYTFYHVNSDLEMADEMSLKENEYLLYTNYFGIKDEYVKHLADRYGEQLIVDCAQALYAKAIPGIKTIYSPRKYVGIPDGGVAYIGNCLDVSANPVDDSSDRMSHLYLRLEKGPQAGYADFKANSHKLVMQPIKQMSVKSRSLIANIDFDEIKSIRRRNCQQLHEALKQTNKLDIPEMSSFECPMAYPYWTSDEELKSRLIQEQIFVATYWPNVLEWTTSDMIENEFAKNLLAIPCDQRYGDKDIKRITLLIAVLNNHSQEKQINTI